MGFARKEYEFLSEIGLSSRNLGCYVNGTWKAHGYVVTSLNPANNQAIAEVVEGSIEDYAEGMQACNEAAKIWMQVPAPKRGEIVRQIGHALRVKLQQLSRLVSLEMGKILPEGIGEVQVYKSCDVGGTLFPGAFDWMECMHCIGLRQLCCLERSTNDSFDYHSYDKASSWGVLKERNNLPPAIFTSFCGGADIGQAIAKDTRIHLVSFTGSSKVGLLVQQTVNQRYGKCLLELSGNNAIILMDDADIQLGVRSILFAAVGIAGQWCTTSRRVVLENVIYLTKSKTS